MRSYLNFVVICLLLLISNIKTQTTNPPPSVASTTPCNPATPSVPPTTPCDPSTPGAGTTPPPSSSLICPAFCMQSNSVMDAQAIVDSKMKEETIASILPYRGKADRISINQQIPEKNQWKYFLADDYIYYVVPQGASPPFYDACFGLMKDVGVVMSGYLSVFFLAQEETWITIALVLTPNIQYLKITYDIYHPDKFQSMIENQRHPYQNMLKKWCAQDREKDEEGDLNHGNVVKDASDLKAEQDNGGWSENREQIEKILMKKSMKYAKAVIQEFEKANGDKPIENIINECITTHQLNPDLADAYASLARFIKCKYKYIADTLRQYSTNAQRWAAWIMCFAVVDTTEWTKINAEYQSEHPDDSLSKLILKENTEDKVMAEMMAAIIDPTFKPTLFTPKSPQGSSGLPYSANAASSSPTNPTTAAPSPSLTNPNTLGPTTVPPPASPTTLASTPPPPTSTTPATPPKPAPPATPPPSP